MAQDPLKYFRVEARELLDQLTKGVLDLEKGLPPKEVVARLLRQAHTLKGAARVVRQRELADLSHALEDMLVPLRDATQVPAGVPSELLKKLDEMTARLAALPVPGAPAPTPATPVTEAAPPAASPRTLRAEIAELDALRDGITETHVQLAGLGRAMVDLDRVRQLSEIVAAQLAAPRGQRSEDPPAKLRAVAEELRVLAGSVARASATSLEQVDRELRQVREAAERLRLVPVSLMFDTLERTARDAAQTTGRRVAFEARGADIRLDAHVLGVLQPALVQAVRNAIAHGVEPESERTLSGKPREGRVSIEVERRGGRVVFRCRDDGRGVDLEAVRRAAEKRGLERREVDRLRADELLRLLMGGGISTAGTVTAVSGRGVGLDVVREATARLGAEVSVRTEARQGTTLELVVPVSLASMQALIGEAGGDLALLPLDAVVKTGRVETAAFSRSSEGQTVHLDGETLPFVSLTTLLHGQAPAAPGRTWPLVVVRHGSKRAALGLDRLVGVETVVVQPMPVLAPPTPLISGGALDASGRPRLVLDAEHLVTQICQPRAMAVPTPVVRAPILVIDDSLTTRMLEKSILESAGYEVEVATSAEEGLEKARLRRYGLFLVDVEMPGMDGFTFVARTRADAVLRETPAILVTSLNAPEDKQRGKDAGAYDYVVKSEFDQGQLLETIRKLVG